MAATPATNHPLLARERLTPGSTVHLIDDLVHSGATLASAATTLREAGLVVRKASCLLTAPPAESRSSTITAAGIQQLSALAMTTDLWIAATLTSRTTWTCGREWH
jgi:adenine/guanine phosphoribosyltransferase-like PRPP-binding protein